MGFKSSGGRNRVHRPATLERSMSADWICTLKKLLHTCRLSPRGCHWGRPQSRTGPRDNKRTESQIDLWVPVGGRLDSTVRVAGQSTYCPGSGSGSSDQSKRLSCIWLTEEADGTLAICNSTLSFCRVLLLSLIVLHVGIITCNWSTEAIILFLSFNLHA